MSVRWNILLGDCRQRMAEIEDRYFDLIIADPPYGDTSLDWDVQVGEWLEPARRVLKASGSIWIFGSFRYLRELDLKGWKLAQDIVWEKHNGSGFHADRFKRVHEHAIHIYQGEWASIYRDPQTTPDAIKRQTRRKRRPTHMGDIEEGPFQSEDGGPRLMRSVMFVRSCHGYATHPTQKPVDLIRPLIRYSSPPGGTVLDPFSGSGSTGEAALREGRSFLGIELDEEYAHKATDRLEALTV